MTENYDVTKLFGRKEAQQDTASLWAEAHEAAEVASRLWDSWEDDAEIRDVATGRFIDRDKLHYIDFAGEYFSVKGPSITPRSPQGQPLVAVTVDGGESFEFAVARADLVRIRAKTVEEAAALAARLRDAVAVVRSGCCSMWMFSSPPMRTPQWQPSQRSMVGPSAHTPRTRCSTVAARMGFAN